MLLPEDLQIPMQVQNVTSVPPWLTFISVEETLAPAYHDDPDAKTNKAHLLMFLNMRHNPKKQVVAYNRTKGDNNAKQPTKNYNRIVFFADCTTQGRVCAKVLETSAESMKFFENVIHGQYGVGNLYVVEEPSPTSEYLGGTTSVIMLGTHTRLYSVQGNMTEAIPTTALRNNRMGETKFFTYHNVKDLKVGSSVVDNTACGGRFCDRQIVSVNASEHVPCGCFHRKDRLKIVTQHSVRIPCATDFQGKNFLTVQHFRSYRFDELLFRGESKKLFHDVYDHSDPVACAVLRKRVVRLIELVNGAHGWTVVGWARTGTVKDASEEGNREALDIASEDLRPHIIFLYPTHEDDLGVTHAEEYDKIAITIDNFNKEIKTTEQEMKTKSRKRKTDSEEESDSEQQ